MSFEQIPGLVWYTDRHHYASFTGGTQ
jgi:hypothetical protein